MSERNYEQEIITLIKANQPMIQVVSFEQIRVDSFVFYAADELNRNLFKWSTSSGLRKYDKDLDEFEVTNEGLTEFQQLLDYFEPSTTDGDECKNSIIICEDAHRHYQHFEDPPYAIVVRKMREIIQRSYKDRTIILSQPLKIVPYELMKELPIIEIELPKKNEIELIYNDVKRIYGLENERDPPEELINAALGLTVMEARLALSKAAIEMSSLDEKAIPYIIKEKEQIIKKNGSLEYFHPKENFNNIGGLDNLKKWLETRENAFNKSAEEYGLEKPKGVLLLGIPGCGKSLSAKAIAAKWQFPLLRFDLGKVYAGIVGQSEQNIRNALDIAKAIAPCVLWIDEIEKGLSGVKSSNQTDSGVSARIFGTFLTWMQEKTEPVFVIATANDISQLPSELLRKGRFDEIFFVDLPTEDERKEIFKIHLKSRNRDPEMFNIDGLAKKTIGYTGSEIEEIIKEAMFKAFHDGKLLHEGSYLENSIKEVVPLSSTMGENLEELRKWAYHRTKPASKSKNQENIKEDREIPRLRQEYNNPFIKRDSEKKSIKR